MRFQKFRCGGEQSDDHYDDCGEHLPRGIRKKPARDAGCRQMPAPLYAVILASSGCSRRKFCLLGRIEDKVPERIRPRHGFATRRRSLRPQSIGADIIFVHGSMRIFLFAGEELIVNWKAVLASEAGRQIAVITGGFDRLSGARRARDSQINEGGPLPSRSRLGFGFFVSRETRYSYRRRSGGRLASRGGRDQAR